jgi:hypothetical protein
MKSRNKTLRKSEIFKSNSGNWIKICPGRKFPRISLEEPRDKQ